MIETPISSRIFSGLVADLFDVPVMGNVVRPHYVERLVAIGLGEGFTLVSADWAGWDIEHRSGIRIEVKQSAALQSWSGTAETPATPVKGTFDIAPRTGHWIGGAQWVEEAGRQAHLYVFAWHPVADRRLADHRDPLQWVFFVVPTYWLPGGQKSIGQTVLERTWRGVPFGGLRDATLAAITALGPRIGSGRRRT